VSLTADFYIRVIFRVKDGAAECHDSVKKYSHVLQCMDCQSFYLQPLGTSRIDEVSLQNDSRRNNKQKLPEDSTDHVDSDEDVI
jgi:tRNA G26 N,N-dimethylase Trm1